MELEKLSRVRASWDFDARISGNPRGIDQPRKQKNPERRQN